MLRLAKAKNHLYKKVMPSVEKVFICCYFTANGLHHTVQAVHFLKKAIAAIKVEGGKNFAVDKAFMRCYTAMVNLIYLRGRVKFPIGGIVRERESAGLGEIPRPTV